MLINVAVNAQKNGTQTDRLSFRVSNLLDTLNLAYTIFRSRPVCIQMFGDDHIRAIHADFTSGHRLIPLVAKKSFGAALIDLKDEAAVNLISRGGQNPKVRKARKALKQGYRFRAMDPMHHLDEIVAINRSAAVRQGRPIAAKYVDAEDVRRVAEKESVTFGVFDRDEVLRAYTHAPILGDAFVFSRILGDHDHLKSGLMYLLVHETLVTMRNRYLECGHPRWAFYDMFLGARPGLRQFKSELGFKPYRVRWEWADL